MPRPVCHKCAAEMPKFSHCECVRPEPHAYLAADVPAATANAFLDRLERGGVVPQTKLHALRKQVSVQNGLDAAKSVINATKKAIAPREESDTRVREIVQEMLARRDTRALYKRELELERGAFRISVVTQTWSPVIPGQVAGSAMMSGSGFLVDLSTIGLVIVTNGHVIRDASTIVVSSALDPTTEIPCSLLRVSFELDLAFLQPNESHPAWRPTDFRPFKLCGQQTTFVQKIDEIEAGHCGVSRLEPVYAIGYPLGVPRVQITQGTISGYQRISDEPVIQITAPINPGSSGGCLVNEDGEVLGITSSGIPSAQVTGFAIPVQTIFALEEAVASTSSFAVRHPATRLPLFGLEYVPSSMFSRMSHSIHKPPMLSAAKSSLGTRPVAFLARAKEERVSLASLVEATEDIRQGIVLTHVQPMSMFASSDNGNRPLVPLDTIVAFAGFDLNDNGLTSEETYPRRVSIEDLFRTLAFGAEFTVKVRRGVQTFVNTYTFSEREEDLPIDEWIKENVEYQLPNTNSVYPGKVMQLGTQLLVAQLSKNLIDAVKDRVPHLDYYYRMQEEPRIVVLNDMTGGSSLGDVIDKIEGTPVRTIQEAAGKFEELAKSGPRFALVKFDNGKYSLVYVSN